MILRAGRPVSSVMQRLAAVFLSKIVGPRASRREDLVPRPAVILLGKPIESSRAWRGASLLLGIIPSWNLEKLLIGNWGREWSPSESGRENWGDFVFIFVAGWLNDNPRD